MLEPRRGLGGRRWGGHSCHSQGITEGEFRKRLLVLGEAEAATLPEHVAGEATASGKGGTPSSGPGEVCHREKRQSRRAVVWRQEHGAGPAEAGGGAPAPETARRSGWLA